MKQALGKQESLFFAYMQLRGQRTVRTGELMDPLQLTRLQERELFRRLARGGLIARVRRGLYLVPPRLPLGGAWSPSEALALNTLIEDRCGQFQICGPNAFNRYGFDDQVPGVVYAYNNRISGERRIGSVELTLIKVSNARLGDTEEVEASDGAIAVYSSRARTLVDGVYDWSRFNSLPRAYTWIRRELGNGNVTAARLVEVALRYGDKGTVRRIGALLEREHVDGKLLRRLEKTLSPSKGLIPWVPTWPKRGTVDRRWGIVWNEGGDSADTMASGRSGAVS